MQKNKSFFLLVLTLLCTPASVAKHLKIADTPMLSWENTAKIVCYKKISSTGEVLETDIFYRDVDDQMIDRHFRADGFKRMIPTGVCQEGLIDSEGTPFHLIKMVIKDRDSNQTLAAELMKLRQLQPELFRPTLIRYSKES